MHHFRQRKNTIPNIVPLFDMTCAPMICGKITFEKYPHQITGFPTYLPWISRPKVDLVDVPVVSGSINARNFTGRFFQLIVWLYDRTWKIPCLLKPSRGKKGVMTEKPCDRCDKECVGGVIYGNCQQFLNWRKEINQINVCLDIFHSKSRATMTTE